MVPEKNINLVSCIMPTYNRREFVPHAIQYFLRQDYPNKELIIIDDGTDKIKDLIPEANNIRYYQLDEKITLGAKLNMACEYSQGNILINWDDDDWYAAHRITYQVNALNNHAVDVCGINRLLYYDIRNHAAHTYTYPLNQRIWLLGSSLCYTRELWNKNKFADIDVGMDAYFVWGTSEDKITALPDSSIAVHLIHDSNVSPKQTDGPWWQSSSVDEIKSIMSYDFDRYHHNGHSIAHPIQHHDINITQYVNGTIKPLKNIYTCCVHEREDCVIDLVKNLYYHDPDSVILLYNGGENKQLFSSGFPYEKYGAVICPNSKVIKYGYLHSFALDCMEFSLKNFSFDIITIVDSDQLCLRPNHSLQIAKFLYPLKNVGVLSNLPKRITQNDIHVYTSIQAFKEYDLWKPLLNQFKDGESKFLHWSFWPSTVFTADAVKELVKIFRNNNQLRQIMQKSEIWATEEVVLPTVTALLGFKIEANPNSYDFVQYKKDYSSAEVIDAFNRPDAYWIHPVVREYNDPIRTQIRQQFNNYNKYTCENKPTNHMLSTLELFKKVKDIMGWLDEAEADLLLSATLKACIELPQPHSIVEVGSFQGKSTVLFGSVVKAYFPSAKVYAIDPHEGVVGDADQVIEELEPTLESFTRNIEQQGLTSQVELIKDYSFNVKWDKPISLLFIDGMHDYMNVSRDFNHFAKWVSPGGYIAFHDYADYFPGVMNFVNETLSTGDYIEIDKAKSLIVVQKL
ncbi:glycosyltransferase [Mucilaginibacter sp.]|uniref:glycosyltransferase n=1 Tax=Mucilaginibacter sp. TaxID=1882438 RepID=UPI002613D559|nr:glycosyltransferase [Mucilaginibacter sp.]MDB5128646.1 glycosyltransferase [Mucilaginibacter sp.]